VNPREDPNLEVFLYLLMLYVYWKIFFVPGYYSWQNGTLMPYVKWFFGFNSKDFWDFAKKIWHHSIAQILFFLPFLVFVLLIKVFHV
jgi:hypothetical protein